MTFLFPVTGNEISLPVFLNADTTEKPISQNSIVMESKK